MKTTDSVRVVDALYTRKLAASRIVEMQTKGKVINATVEAHPIKDYGVDYGTIETVKITLDNGVITNLER